MHPEKINTFVPGAGSSQIKTLFGDWILVETRCQQGRVKKSMPNSPVLARLSFILDHGPDDGLRGTEEWSTLLALERS